MKVKKINRFVLSIAAVVLLAGCSKDSLVSGPEPTPISFKFFSGALSKARPMGQADIASMTVAAYSGTNQSDVFFQDFFSCKDEDANAWGSSTNVDYYWPYSGNLTFLAYYPGVLNGTLGQASASAETSTSGTVYAFSSVEPSLRASQQHDFIVGLKPNVAKTTSAINVYMQHALSQIDVKARSNNPNINILVKGIKLVNIYKKAKLTLSSETTSGDRFTSSMWANQTSNGKTTYYAGGETTTGAVYLSGSATEAKSVMMGEGTFMLIPQTNGPWNGTNTNNVTGSYVAVLCQIWQKNSTAADADSVLLYPTSASSYGWAAVGIGPNWEPGVKYTYTLNFFLGDDGGAGSIPPDQSNPNTNNPQVPEEGQGGTSVAGGALSFTVTAATWGGEDGGGELTPAEASSLAFPEANLITLENQQ